MEKNKNENGITLVALVVTIVVLVILAGVSINLLLGENGVITRAKEGTEEYKKVAANETEMMKQDNIDELIGSSGPTVKKDQNGVEQGESGYLGDGYNDPYIPKGFKHIGTDTWNSGYTIIGQTQSIGNEFVWVPCVLDQKKVKEGDTVVTFRKILPSTTETTDPLYKYNQNNVTITGEESSTTDIRTSVGIHGGFYIAKYEAGVPGTTESTTTTEGKTTVDGSVKPVSKPNVGVWNLITRTNSITVSEAMIDTASTGAKSALISGECWDTTLAWITKTDSTYAENSTGKGWYSDVSSSKLHITGYYAINNIYDMAGNVWEWTTENCTDPGNAYLVRRGGNYPVSGSDYPAAYRSNGIDDANYRVGFRPVLYK